MKNTQTNIRIHFVNNKLTKTYLLSIFLIQKMVHMKIDFLSSWTIIKRNTVLLLWVKKNGNKQYI